VSVPGSRQPNTTSELPVEMHSAGPAAACGRDGQNKPARLAPVRGLHERAFGYLTPNRVEPRVDPAPMRMHEAGFLLTYCGPVRGGQRRLRWRRSL